MATTLASMKQAFARLMSEENRAKLRVLRSDVLAAFTTHPRDTGETYFEHLMFTCGMALRLLYAMSVLVIHGLFPFLLTRAASSQIEVIYRIIKTRIPKARRDEIDLDYSV